jgi:dihydrolipoamide dehydrogenase
MVVGTATKGCQCLVVGGGPAGYAAAIRLAQLGKDVVLVEERSTLGGVCLNEGCIPSKALIHAAQVASDAREASRMGITVGEVKVDLAKVQAWKEGIVRNLTNGVKFLCDKHGVEVVQGRATFLSDRRASVETANGTVLVEFEQAVIAAGTRPVEVPALPVDGKTVIGSREALSLVEVPPALVVVGAGYIGVELGTLYRKLGAEVTLVEALPTLLPALDRDVATVVERRLKQLGVKVLLGRRVEGVDPGERVSVRVSLDGKAEVLAADKVLVTVGRKPDTLSLGLEAAGVRVDAKGFIPVSNRMATNVPGIYAIGDVTGGPMLAHRAYRQAKVAAEVMAGKPAAYDNVACPAVIYGDPEVATVGMTEEEARRAGVDVVTGSFPLKASGRAMSLGATQGLVKLVADKRTRRVLGMAAVGVGVSELVAEATLALEMGALLDDLAATIHPHPTLSESVLEAADLALGQCVHLHV